jgi:hypothetical protein
MIRSFSLLYIRDIGPRASAGSYRLACALTVHVAGSNRQVPFALPQLDEGSTVLVIDVAVEALETPEVAALPVTTLP